MSPPHTLLARQDALASNASDSTSSSTDSSASDSSDVDGKSFMDEHGKQVYIALAVVGIIIFFLLIWGYAKSRLSFWPFKQKRCSGSNSCGSGIAKTAKLDIDYFKNERRGWRCRKCQEKKEDQDLEDELEADQERRKRGAGRAGRNDEKRDNGRRERGEKRDDGGSTTERLRPSDQDRAVGRAGRDTKEKVPPYKEEEIPVESKLVKPREEDYINDEYDEPTARPRPSDKDHLVGRVGRDQKERAPPYKKEEERPVKIKPAKRREEDYSTDEYDEPEPPRKFSKSKKKKADSDDDYSD